MLQGRSALYITNREDEDLKVKIENTFKPSRLVWKAIEKCTAQSNKGINASITRGSYDVVLMTESWLSHGTTEYVQTLCKKLHVPLVYAGKGKVSELGTELGKISVPKRNNQNLVTRGPNWSGPELFMVKKLLDEHKSYQDITKELNTTFDNDRTESATSRVALEYFGYGKSGHKTREPSKTLPQSYQDLAQAARISKECEDQKLASKLAIQEKVESRLEVKHVQEENASIRITADGDKALLVALEGPKGTAIVETQRSIPDILAFLMGHANYKP